MCDEKKFATSVGCVSEIAISATTVTCFVCVCPLCMTQGKKWRCEGRNLCVSVDFLCVFDINSEKLFKCFHWQRKNQGKTLLFRLVKGNFSTWLTFYRVCVCMYVIYKYKNNRKIIQNKWGSTYVYKKSIWLHHHSIDMNTDRRR